MTTRRGSRFWTTFLVLCKKEVRTAFVYHYARRADVANKLRLTMLNAYQLVKNSGPLRSLLHTTAPCWRQIACTLRTQCVHLQGIDTCDQG